MLRAPAISLGLDPSWIWVCVASRVVLDQGTIKPRLMFDTASRRCDKYYNSPSGPSCHHSAPGPVMASIAEGIAAYPPVTAQRYLTGLCS